MKTLRPAFVLLTLASSLVHCAPGTEDDSLGSDLVACLGPYDCRLNNPTSDSSNRYDDPHSSSGHWPLRAGTHLVDGAGNDRGVIASTEIQVNYGQRKNIGGATHVYGFAVSLVGGTTASGWVDQGAITHDIARMPTVNASDPGHGDYETHFVITGGDANAYGDLKVERAFSGHNGAASDYLLRPGNVINLLYNLPGVGGVACDTLPAGTPFRRSLGVLQVQIPLYHPGSSTVVGSEPFVYGHVGSRYGWVARAAIVPDYLAAQGVTSTDPASDPPEPSSDPSTPPSGDPSGTPTPPTPAPPAPATGQCYVRCCDGSLQGPIATTDPGSCGAQSGVCSGHGSARHIEFNGGDVYTRPTTCWAKCSNRDAYHEVVGVTSGCTDAARAFCAQNDRGRFVDAAWDACEP